MSTTISELKTQAFYQMDISTTSKISGGQKTETFSDVFGKTQGTEVTAETKVDKSVKKEDAESIQNHAKIQKNKNQLQNCN